MICRGMALPYPGHGRQFNCQFLAPVAGWRTSPGDFSTMYRACLSLIALSLTIAPAFAQSRYEVQARERAMQHARDAAVRAAENPEPVAQAAAQATPPATPVEPAAASADAPATGAAQAAPASAR